MTTPSATNANAQYDAVVEKLTALLAGSSIDVISTVPGGGGADSSVRWLAKGPQSCLVLYETAEDAIARGFLAGQMPSQALARWVVYAEALLAGHRQRRRQLTLASITAVLAHPQDFRLALSQRFEEKDFSGEWLASEQPAWSALQGLLARQIVSDDADARRLSDALEAAALPLSAYRYDADSAASELDAPHADREQLEAQLQAAVDQMSDREAERTLLRDQIGHLQQAIQDNSGVAAGHHQQMSKMKLALTAAEDRIEGLEATLTGAATQAARDKASIDALNAQKQKLLDTLNKLVAKALNSKELQGLPWKSRRARQIKIVREWGIVDPDWYLQYHQDVANAGVEPFKHYVDHGIKEGRPPNAGFT